MWVHCEPHESASREGLVVGRHLTSAGHPLAVYWRSRAGTYLHMMAWLDLGLRAWQQHCRVWKVKGCSTQACQKAELELGLTEQGRILWSWVRRYEESWPAWEAGETFARAYVISVWMWWMERLNSAELSALPDRDISFRRGWSGEELGMA